MIKVTRQVPVPVDMPVTIELDAEAAREFVHWLEDADTPMGTPYNIWDALDDVVKQDKAESIRPRTR